MRCEFSTTVIKAVTLIPSFCHLILMTRACSGAVPVILARDNLSSILLKKGRLEARHGVCDSCAARSRKRARGDDIVDGLIQTILQVGLGILDVNSSVQVPSKPSSVVLRAVISVFIPYKSRTVAESRFCRGVAHVLEPRSRKISGVQALC